MNDSLLNSPILVGGSGSSGSTLLAALLDNHPDIVCGPEMSFFSKADIYGDFATFRRNLPKYLEKGVPTRGYLPAVRMLRRKEFYGFSAEDMIQWASESTDLQAFVIRMQQHVLELKEKKRFAEKTPLNSYCFRQFSEVFPEAKIVHITRDGRDVACSLMKRGYSMFQATSRWLCETSAGLACRDLPGYYELRYEDLVREPERIVRGVCEHIGAEFSPQMLERDSGNNAGGSDAKTWQRPGQETWQNSPRKSPISAKSVGRYKKDLTGEQSRQFYGVSLTRAGAERFGFRPVSTADVLRELGHEVPEVSVGGYPLSAMGQVVRDYLWRTKTLLPFGRLAGPMLTWVRFKPE